MPQVVPSSRLAPHLGIRWFVAMVFALGLSVMCLAVGPYVLGYASGIAVVLLCFMRFVPGRVYGRTTTEELPPPSSDESTEFVLAELRAKMAVQLERKRILENKASIFTSVVVILTSLALHRIQVVGWNPSTQHGALALLLITSLLATIVAAVAAVWPRMINVPPDPDGLAVDIDKPVQTLQTSMIHSFREAYPGNERQIRSVAGFVKCTAVLVVADVILAAAVLSSTIQQAPPC